jgi:hypothetical protein
MNGLVTAAVLHHDKLLQFSSLQCISMQGYVSEQIPAH